MSGEELARLTQMGKEADVVIGMTKSAEGPATIPMKRVLRLPQQRLIPYWLMKYVHNDPSVHRAASEAELRGETREVFMENLAKQLLQERETFRAASLLHYRQTWRPTPPPTLPEHLFGKVAVSPEELKKVFNAQPTDWTQDLEHGFKLVPFDQVTANGLYMASLPVALPINKWACLDPRGKALQNENGGTYVYRDMEEERRDVRILQEYEKAIRFEQHYGSTPERLQRIIEHEQDTTKPTQTSEGGLFHSGSSAPSGAADTAPATDASAEAAGG